MYLLIGGGKGFTSAYLDLPHGNGFRCNLESGQVSCKFQYKSSMNCCPRP